MLHHNYLMLSLYFTSLPLVLVFSHFHYMFDFPHLPSHYLNRILLSYMSLSYYLLHYFPHSIDNYYLTSMSLNNFMHLFLLLLHLYIIHLSSLLITFDYFHYMLHLYNLVRLPVSYLSLMYFMQMLMYSLHTFIVIHLHLNNLLLLLVSLHLLSNYYLLIASSSLHSLMLLLSPLLNAHFNHMSMLLFTMLLLSTSSLYYNQMLLPLSCYHSIYIHYSMSLLPSDFMHLPLCYY